MTAVKTTLDQPGGFAQPVTPTPALPRSSADAALRYLAEQLGSVDLGAIEAQLAAIELELAGLTIGEDVQAWSANLDSWSGGNLSSYSTTAQIAAAYQPLDTQLTEWAGIDPSANGASLVSAANYAVMRGLLDLEAGTDFLSPAAIAAAYQPIDASLTAYAALATAANKGIYYSGADTPVTYDLTAFGRALGGYADEAAFKAGVNLEAGTDFLSPAAIAATYQPLDGATSGVAFSFDTGVTDADPGAGKLRFNNATPGLATQIFISDLNVAGVNVSAWPPTWDDAGSASDRGILILQGAGGTPLLVARVTGTIVDAGVYSKVPITVISIAGTFASGARLGAMFASSGILPFPLSTVGDRWGTITSTAADGVTEIGMALDFHGSDADATDFNYRIVKCSFSH